MSAMNSPLLCYRSFLYSIPLSHMWLQSYNYYLKRQKNEEKNDS